MRKIIFTNSRLLLMLAMVLILAAISACTSTTTQTVTSPVPTTVTVTSPPVTVTSPPVTVTVTPTPPPTPTPPADAIPPEMTQYAKDWPLANKDYANTRSTTDSNINSSNVNTLGVAWGLSIPGTGLFGSASTTPIIMGDTVYFQDLGNNVVALDLATGAIKWQKNYNEVNIGPNGVAVAYGQVFGTIDPAHMGALDMSTGTQKWTSQVTDQPTTGTDIQPVAYDGMVFTSTVPGSSGGDFYSGGASGIIYAIDQATGKIVWSFDTVDSADIWGNPAVNSGGGCWYPPAVDTKTGILYFGIGNPAPWPGTADYPNGSSRPGPNLYTDCMIALDAHTGKLIWYTQVYPHDNHDLDFQMSPILTNANINGQQQDIAIGAGKGGRVVAFNRTTGAILWETPVGMHQNDNLVSVPSGNATRVYPGSLGGVETPMAYSDGIVYVPLLNLYNDYTPSAQVGGEAFNQGTGELVAIQVATGKILWDNTFPSINVGGATVVNDLVFTTTFDGKIFAFNKTTGAQVWTYQVPGGINAWPAFAGDYMLLPVGLGNPFPVLMGFKLGASAPALTIKPDNGATVTSGNVTISAMAFNFTIVDKQGQANVAGEGHLHYYMDVDAPTTPDTPAIPTSGSWTHTTATSYTFTNVMPGTHTFSVELVNNDHTPLNPPVVQKITVNVQAPGPMLTIVSPQNRSTTKPGSVTITVQVSNFNLVAAPGTGAAGEGHLIYYLDVVAPIAAGQPATTAAGTYYETADTSYTWTNVAAGTHTFTVQLVNDDGTPLTTPVTVKVVVIASISAAGGP